MRKLKWKEVRIGGVLQGGTAVEFKTGDWRSEKPVWEEGKCNSCLLCFMYCPDNCIIITEEPKVKGINLDYCKGCGICEEECKVGAIKMVREEK